MAPQAIACRLGTRDYLPVFDAMCRFTAARHAATGDEIWLVEHPPVFTLGRAAALGHLRDPGGIPVVRSDRGGQVTYHGPGQLVVYPLLDLRRRALGVRELVTMLERTVIGLLATYGISGARRRGAPGVYVAGKKIAALGLRVRRGCCYHGLSLNVAMDLDPFRRIDPCGYPGLAVTQLSALGAPTDLERVARDLLDHLTVELGCGKIVVHDAAGAAAHPV